MTPESFQLVVYALLAGLVVLICMVGYLIKLQIPATGSKTASAATAANASVPVASGPIHPGLSDEEFMAVIGAAVAQHSLSNEKLIAILTAAAAHTLGMPVSVVKFKPLSTMDWTWAVQGRVALHTNKV
ncbi:MAG: OadG family protein [Fibromonadaceae bacterium]|jgi:Na+-transporting methylmalonyl-CoA/oxaloacetate decarboxylase gamma subunit|nr:OadG family protein [Fibromonadaceae bacterium]